MGIQVSANRRLGLVLMEFQGYVEAAEFQRVTDLIEVPELSLLPMLLVDASHVEGTSSPSAQIRDAARRVQTHVDPKLEAPDARVAIVAVTDEFFGLGRMYQMLRGESQVDVRVFRDLAEAEDWLGLPADYRAGLEQVQP
jgi:hypothetical protein